MVSRIKLNKIVLFGDSITELSSNQDYGFNLAPALQHEYFRKLQVITHGYGGYNTEHARHILDPVLDAESTGGSEIRLLTIFFGANDAAEVSNTQQHVPLERYAENLRFLLLRAQGRCIPVILIGPAFTCRGGEDVNEDDLSVISFSYSEVAREVAGELNVPFVNLWNAFSQQGDRKDLFTDGVHLSGKGYRILYDLILHTIREQYPLLRTENLHLTFPHIFDIDNNDLPASLLREASHLSKSGSN